jgi:tetratricopeptide (TPR) repeat protein
VVTLKVRPSTELELADNLRMAYDLVQNGQYEEALRICDWLSEDPSTRCAGVRERAAVREHMGDFDGAIRDLRNVIAMNTDEPNDYHQLGILLLRGGYIDEAIVYLSKAIELEKAINIYYYTNSCLLHKAYAELCIGNWQKAKLDCQSLPAGYKIYLYGKGMVSREQIESEVDIGISGGTQPSRG